MLQNVSQGRNGELYGELVGTSTGTITDFFDLSGQSSYLMVMGDEDAHLDVTHSNRDARRTDSERFDVAQGCMILRPEPGRWHVSGSCPSGARITVAAMPALAYGDGSVANLSADQTDSFRAFLNELRDHRVVSSLILSTADDDCKKCFGITETIVLATGIVWTLVWFGAAAASAAVPIVAAGMVAVGLIGVVAVAHEIIRVLINLFAGKKDVTSGTFAHEICKALKYC
jgi:hypothetical protein